jgi:hypothetical protein
MSDFDKVRLLMRKDMELEVQLENITNKAIKPQIVNNVPPPVIKKKTKEPIFMNTPQAIADLELRDMAYEIELENITNKQIDAAPDVKPTVVKSVVTKEMIEDYQIEQTNPVKIGDQYFRYTPSSLTIDLEVPNLVDVPIPKEDIPKLLREAEEQYSENVKEIEYDQKRNIAQRQALVEKFDIDDSQLKTMISRKRQPKGGPQKSELIKRQKALARTFQENLEYIDSEYMLMTDALNAEETAYKIFVKKCENTLENHKNNEDEMRRVNATNQFKLKEYAGDLTRLNQQFGNIQQGSNETDEEFKNRLESLVVPISDDQKIEADGRLDFVQAKRNLKQFFTDGARVEVLVKKLSPEDRSSFNKFFTKIKTDYLAKYGVDNKRISDEELVNYITEAIKQPNFASSSAKPTTPAAPVEAVEAVLMPDTPAGIMLKDYAISVGVNTGGKPTIRELIIRINSADHYIPVEIYSRFNKESDKEAAIIANLNLDQTRTRVRVNPLEEPARERPPPPPPPSRPPMSFLEGIKSGPKLKSSKPPPPPPSEPPPARPLSLLEGIKSAKLRPTKALPPPPPAGPPPRIESLEGIESIRRSDLGKKLIPEGRPPSTMSLLEAIKSTKLKPSTARTDKEEPAKPMTLLDQLKMPPKLKKSPPKARVKSEVPENPMMAKLRSLRSAGPAAEEEDEGTWDGSGIRIKKYPKIMRFGKVCISPDDLYYKNMLRIRLHNKRSILGLPDIRVSDTLATIIMKIVDGNRVTKSDLSVLSKKDKMIYDKLMVVSGLHKTVDNSFNESAEEMKQRLRLIEGEIGAGNDNPLLMKESHQLLHSMHACGMISHKAANQHYRHLKSFFE